MQSTAIIRLLMGGSVVVFGTGVSRPLSAQSSVCQPTAVTVTEGFDDTVYQDESRSSVDGWGAAELTLTTKGSSVDRTVESFGVRVLAMAGGDFDADGNTDLVAQLLSPSCHLHFLRNRGQDTSVDPPTSRGFSAGGIIGSTGFDRFRIDDPPDCSSVGGSLLSGDFDGDGDSDFFYMTIRDQDTNGRLNHAYYYENLGSSGGLPRFAPRRDLVSQFFNAPHEPAWHWISNSQLVVDWDDDGLDDVVLASSYGSSSRVLLFRSTGSGFERGYTLLDDTGLRPPFADDGAPASSDCTGNSRGITAISAEDFDGDDDRDLVIGSVSQPDLMYWRNDGSDAFTQVPDIVFPQSGAAFVFGADFDRDGDVDLMVGRDGFNCGGEGGRVYFFTNDGRGVFTRRLGAVIDVGFDLDYGAAFDIDGDSHGSVDLIAADSNDQGNYNQILAQDLSFFNLRGVAQSTTLDSLPDTTTAIVKVRVDVDDEIPSGTDYTLYVSANGGQNWEEVSEKFRYGQADYTFKHFGSDLRWRLELKAEQDRLSSDQVEHGPAATKTPRISRMTFTYYYVDRRLYSRSSVALASDLRLADGSDADVLYSSAFLYPGFEGRLYAHDISDFSGDPSASTFTSVSDDANTRLIWEGGEMLRDASGASRTIYTSRDSDDDGQIDDRVVFAEGNASLLALDMAMSTTAAEELIDYVRGGMGHRDRWKLYDAGHSSPVFVGAPAEDAEYAMFSSADYDDFVTAQSNRAPRVYIGSNSGMIHAFDATTGLEAWAYIPHNLLARLKQQQDIDSTGSSVYSHQFLVDGQLTVRDVYDTENSRWRTVLISGQALGQARGDNNYYFALDISDPNDPLPLWEFTNSWDTTSQTCSGETRVTVCDELTCNQSCSDDCDAPSPIFNEARPGEIFIEAESFNTNTTIDGIHEWIDEGSACPRGLNGSGVSGTCLRAVPTDEDLTCLNDQLSECGAQLVYSVNIPVEGRYRIYARGFAATEGRGDTVLVFMNDVSQSRFTYPEDGNWHWLQGTGSHVLTPGDHALTVYMQKNGIRIDRLLLSRVPSSLSDTEFGPEQSCVNQCFETDCVQNCSEVVLDQDDEWPECGVGAGRRCCIGATSNVCHAVGETCPDVGAALGETWSRPVVGRVQVDGAQRFVVFFGSGYDNLPLAPDAIGRSVYAIDAVNGRLFKRWDFEDLATGPSNPSTIDNTVPGTPELVDLDDDGDIDRLYVGDLEGRLWKVQMDNEGILGGGEVSDASWPSCVVFDAGDPDDDGDRTWAPIITKPAVAFPAGVSSAPHLYFGTGGDDRVPMNLRHRFYAIQDDRDCQIGNRDDPLVTSNDLSINDLEWVVGDGLATDFRTPIDPADAEGDENDRYWSDPVVLDNTKVFFASLPGSVESVDPCQDLGAGAKFYGYAVRPFYDHTASVQRRAGESVFTGTSFLQAGVRIRQAAVLRKNGVTPGVTRRGEIPRSAPPTDIFIQQFSSGDNDQPDVLSVTAPRIGRSGTKIRVIRWREIFTR